MEKKLDSEWRRCLRNKVPLSVVMIDIDRFKEFNDRYGHLKGDSCLTALAWLMESFCKRSGDLCARYGAEEFVLLLPDTPSGDASVMVEKIREAVETLNTPHERSEYFHVTISAGIAAEIPSEARNPDQLLSDADRMLYKAKDAGHNQLFLSEDFQLSQPGLFNQC